MGDIGIHLNEDVLDELADRVAKRIQSTKHNEQVVLKPLEAAKRLRVSRAHLYNLLATGAIPSFKIGKSRRVRLQDIEQYVERQIAESATFERG